MNCPYDGFFNRKPMIQKLALKKISFFLRDIRLRLPFRFGAFTAEEVSLLHLAAEVEVSNGRRVNGFAADNLTNVPVVPLQQDLAAVRALGIPHLERNGHHYVRGLDHCSPREREAAIRLHGDLYQGEEREAFLKIENGRIRVDSLNVPGYGVAFEPDLSSMIPLEEWPEQKGATLSRPSILTSGF